MSPPTVLQTTIPNKIQVLISYTWGIAIKSFGSSCQRWPIENQQPSTMHVVNTKNHMDTLVSLVKFGLCWDCSVIYRFFGSEKIVDVQNICPPILATHVALGVSEVWPNRTRLNANQPSCVEEQQKNINWCVAGNGKMIRAKNEKQKFYFVPRRTFTHSTSESTSEIASFHWPKVPNGKHLVVTHAHLPI